MPVPGPAPLFNATACCNSSLSSSACVCVWREGGGRPTLTFGARRLLRTVKKCKLTGWHRHSAGTFGEERGGFDSDGQEQL